MPTGAWLSSSWITTASSSTATWIWPGDGYTSAGVTNFSPVTIQTGTTVQFASTVTWPAWNGASSLYLRRELTPEEEEQQRERERLWAIEQERAREVAAERDRARHQADERAHDLLLSVLNDEQRRTYRQHGWFCTNGRSGKKYRIERGWSHNVKELNEQDRPVRSLCAHPEIAVPHEDNMVAQKLMIEFEEEAFLRTANSYRLAAA